MNRTAAKTCLLAISAMLIVSRSEAQQDPLTPDHGLQDGKAILEQHPKAYRALPSVFIVNSIANGTLYCPTHVNCDEQALAELYDNAVTADAVPAGCSEAMFKWAHVAIEPDKFLHVSDQMQTIELHDAVLGHGTAYAVSREGLLLTNRHVIDNDVIMPFGFDVEPVGFIQMITDCTAVLGTFDGESMAESLVLDELQKWYASKCDRRKVTARLAIAAAYQEERIGNKTDASDIAVQLALKAFGDDVRKPILIPVEVVATGAKDANNELVNDIAVLRIKGDAKDSLICLPLADDKEVAAGAPIYSLGFPGYKYDLTTKQLAGLYKVNVEPGSILELPFAWTTSPAKDGLVTMRAKLRPGCSGGPVILTNGRVAAMNVAHFESELSRRFLFKPETTGVAVSLSEIKKLLAAPRPIIGITLDVGPTTKLWNQALDDYLRGDRTAAAEKLSKVAAAQQFRSAAFNLPQPIVNQYVSELTDLCKGNDHP